ncbi:MAG: universal stress protein, partial [Mycobacterium sp.]|nr:universal stress protein [Mycobacterium sp.]
MTVVVGYRAGKVGLSGLQLAASVARTFDTSLTVATIVPKPRLAPSLARVGAGNDNWADQLAVKSQKEAARFLHNLANGIEVGYVDRAHRSVSG